MPWGMWLVAGLKLCPALANEFAATKARSVPSDTGSGIGVGLQENGRCCANVKLRMQFGRQALGDTEDERCRGLAPVMYGALCDRGPQLPSGKSQGLGGRAAPRPRLTQGYPGTMMIEIDDIHGDI